LREIEIFGGSWVSGIVLKISKISLGLAFATVEGFIMNEVENGGTNDTLTSLVILAI